MCGVFFTVYEIKVNLTLLPSLSTIPHHKRTEKNVFKPKKNQYGGGISEKAHAHRRLKNSYIFLLYVSRIDQIIGTVMFFTPSLWLGFSKDLKIVQIYILMVVFAKKKKKKIFEHLIIYICYSCEEKFLR